MSNKPIADRYEIKGKCGEGAYGSVYLAVDLKSNGLKVAIKKIKLNIVEEGVPISSLREISLMKELNHVNIIKLKEVVHLDNNIILVFDYCESDLKYILKKSPKGLPIKQVKSYMYQLLKGIEYIHKMKILHRDIKSDNLLITKDGVLKIGDFGLARGFGLPISNFRNDVVSLWYRAPDILLGNESYETSVDIWSCGCILAEMAKGQILFQGYSESDQIVKIFEFLGTPGEEKNYKMYKKYNEYTKYNY